MEVSEALMEQDSMYRCPKCNADLDAGPIPEEYHEHYKPPYRYSRLIGIYDYEKDRTVRWKCPDCEQEWE